MKLLLSLIAFASSVHCLNFTLPGKKCQKLLAQRYFFKKPVISLEDKNYAGVVTNGTWDTFFGLEGEKFGREVIVTTKFSRTFMMTGSFATEDVNCIQEFFNKDLCLEDRVAFRCGRVRFIEIEDRFKNRFRKPKIIQANNEVKPVQEYKQVVAQTSFKINREPSINAWHFNLSENCGTFFGKTELVVENRHGANAGTQEYWLELFSDTYFKNTIHVYTRFHPIMQVTHECIQEFFNKDLCDLKDNSKMIPFRCGIMRGISLENKNQ